MKRCLFALLVLAGALLPAAAREIKLKEVTVNARQRQVLHALGFVREFSELTSGGDTIFLYREKWVDFMLPSASVKRFQGWKLPRILSSKSYYHFTDIQGLDSVSDRFNHHFSWADWLQMPAPVNMPKTVSLGEGTDTIVSHLFGRPRPAEIWRRSADDVIDLSVNVLADSTNRRWVPALNSFFASNVDFERFDLRYIYKGVGGNSVTPHDLDALTATIESNGRGRDLYRFGRGSVPYYVRTYAEMYVADREYISVADAREIERNPFSESELLRLTPAELTPLDPRIQSLIARVNAIDTLAIRTNIPVDHNLIGRDLIPLTRKQKIIRRLRGMVGLPLQHYDKSHKIF